MRFLLILLSVFSLCLPSVSVGADGGKKGVQITFLPPPIENASYSLGIYEAKSGKMVRRLHEGATEEAFTAGLNGLITTWDGKDDAGKPVPAGRYSARGYGVGPLKIEGVGITGNDWAREDETLRIAVIEAIAMIPADGGLAVLATMADGGVALLRFSGSGDRVWRKPVSGTTNESRPWLKANDTTIFVMPRTPAAGDDEVHGVASFLIADGAVSTQSLGVVIQKAPFKPLPPNAILRPEPSPGEFAPTIAKPDLSLSTGNSPDKTHRDDARSLALGKPWIQRSSGKDQTAWVAAGLAGLLQTAPDGTVLRKLEPAPGEPLPVSVSASTSQDRLYLLEERKGWQRVRGLSWVETKEENGQPVSTWETFFERSIRTPEALVDAHGAVAPLEIGLVKNPLDPGKEQKVRLEAEVDAKGSYLATADGLHLRRISQSEGLKLARLAKGQAAGSLSFYQSDGAAWDEFSIEGADQMMSFDAGEIEMTATGEKPGPKATEPDL